MANTITISRTINAPRERVWKALVTPEDIMKYNYADEGWTTPHAILDVRPGGTFNIGFQSPDGKSSFDLVGTYTEVVENEKLGQELGDGRPVLYTLEDQDGKTKITIEFEMETENTEEKQREGWTKIMDHLAGYVESKEE